MKILLTTLNAKYIHTNLAIRLLYDLNKEYEGLEWKEFSIKDERKKVAEYCAQYQIVALSCYIWNITQTLELCALIKKINPSAKILLGGPEVSYEWEDIIALDSVDYIICGEGEVPFRTFLDDFPNLNKVPGLVRKEADLIICNPEPKTFDLNNYQGLMPYANEDPAELQNKILYIETSRGCPYKCEFCLASLDNKVRYLPMETIKETLLFMMQNGKVIKFLDRTFNVKRVFTLEIFQFILDNHKAGNVFQFEITADIIHPDIVDFIRKNVPKDLFRFEIGIQTVNQKANLEVQRKQNFYKTAEIVKQLDDLIEMHLDLIVGLPFDYWEDIKYSIEEVFKLFPPELQLGFLKFLKGTPMREKEQHGFVFDPNPPYQLIESKYLSKDELARIVQLENALEIYWNKKRALNTLRYITAEYSIFEFLLELGNYFEEKSDPHRYTLAEVFDNLLAYVEKSYPDDKILKQFVALDYYIYSKIRPKIFSDIEIPIHKISGLSANYEKKKSGHRNIAIALDFNFEQWLLNYKVEEEKTFIIIEYNGSEKGRLAEQIKQSTCVN